MNGRGSEHIREYLANPHVTITHIVDVDGRIGRRAVDAVAKQQGSTPKLLRDLRQALDDKSVDIVSHRHAQPLARPGGHLGHAGRQRRLRGKAREPQRERRPPHRRDGPQVQQRICQTGTQCRSMQGTIEAIEYVHGGKDRRGEAGPRLVLQAARRRSVPRAITKCRPKSITTCGPARRAMLPLTRQKFPLRLALAVASGATATWAIRARTRWTSPAGAWASTVWPDRVLSYGGRLGYEDAGDVANTEVGVFRLRAKDAGLRGPRPGDRSPSRGQGGQSSSTAAKATSC